MNQVIKIIYICLFILSILFYLYNWKLFLDKKNILLDIKYLLVIATSIFVTYSLYVKNKENDTYILPFLLFINIGILLFLTIKYKVYNILHLLSFIGILYLLSIYDYKKFKFTNGILNNPDKYWIYMSILILLVYYLTMNSKMSTKRGIIVACLLVVYPLLFPIEEYFIHRIYSLLFITAINIQFFKTLH